MRRRLRRRKTRLAIAGARRWVDPTDGGEYCRQTMTRTEKSVNRRSALQSIGWVGVAAAMPGCDSTPRARSVFPYQVYGSGPCLFLGATLPDDVRAPFIEGLLERYRVVAFQMPTGEARANVQDVFTAERACAEVLSVAEAVGADRFAYYGYSWGGTLGLQLADRTDRLTALICGGWPPLGAPYPGMAVYTEANAARDSADSIWATYYRSIANWNEHEAVSRFTCPRMAFAGSDDVIEADGITVPIGPLIAAHREDLEEMGWTVALVNGFDHELGRSPEIVVPMVREFLDGLQLGA